jgi:hypothetical protein
MGRNDEMLIEIRREPYVGQVLANADDAEILALRQINETNNGIYASWTVLCRLPRNTYTPYVVWTLIDRPEGWYCCRGDYFRSEPEATRRYGKRS